MDEIQNNKNSRKRIRRKTSVFSYELEPKNINFNLDNKIIKFVAETAQEFGVDIYLVGGYVRDFILNKEVKDIDFTIVGDSIAFANYLAKKLNKEPILYERFRTAMIVTDDYNLEFVGTRKEVYNKESRNPIVTVGSLYDDIARRDFTINSLAISLNSKNYGELIDFFNGYNDIKNKIVKTPLEPDITFSDDPLRMIRAIRFAAKLGFKIEEKTLESITKMSERIKIISQERISDEFLKILASDNPETGIELLYKTNLLKYIFPELNDLAGVELVEKSNKIFAHKDVLRHSIKVLENIKSYTDNVWLRFVALTHDIAKPATKKFIDNVGWTFYGHEDLGAKWMRKIFKRMKFPFENLKYVETLISLHQRPMQLVDEEVTDSAIRRLAFQAGEYLQDLFTLVKADITTKNPNLSEQYKNNYEKVFNKVIEVQEKDKLREFQSPVRGEEIMEICNLQPSKKVGLIKKKIEDAILDGLIDNNYDAAKLYFLENKDKWLEELSN